MTVSCARPWIASTALLLAAILSALAAAERSPRAALLDLEGQTIDPFEKSEAGWTVFLFVRTDCPISNRYAPEIRRLQEKFAPQGVVFWLVYPDPDESAEQIERHRDDYGYSFGALRDPRHALVQITEATTTPEAALFSADGHMLYRGRIDDWYVDFGEARPRPTTRDLQEALEAALDGRPVPRPRTRAVGCFIPDLR